MNLSLDLFSGLEDLFISGLFLLYPCTPPNPPPPKKRNQPKPLPLFYILEGLRNWGTDGRVRLWLLVSSYLVISLTELPCFWNHMPDSPVSKTCVEDMHFFYFWKSDINCLYFLFKSLVVFTLCVRSLKTSWNIHQVNGFHSFCICREGKKEIYVFKLQPL